MMGPDRAMMPTDLTGIPLFQGLRAEQLETLAPLFRPAHFVAGETPFEAGDEATFLYVLETGQVAIRFHPYDGGRVHVTTLSAGAVFGWSAALGRERYTAAADCLTEIRALAIRGADLRHILNSAPELGQTLLERMTRLVAARPGFSDAGERMSSNGSQPVGAQPQSAAP